MFTFIVYTVRKPIQLHSSSAGLVLFLETILTLEPGFSLFLYQLFGILFLFVLDQMKLL